MTIISFLYVDFPKFLPISALLRKAKGWPYCISTMPIATPDASLLITKGLVKLDITSIGVLHITIFKLLKALPTVSNHVNESLFNKVVKGVIILP